MNSVQEFSLYHRLENDDLCQGTPIDYYFLYKSGNAICVPAEHIMGRKDSEGWEVFRRNTSCFFQMVVSTIRSYGTFSDLTFSLATHEMSLRDKVTGNS